jgi:hypothetical protein
VTQPKPWALYQAWIGKWLRKNDPYGKCHEASIEMQEQFPHLRLVRGHYHDVMWGEREHWWLVDDDENIVDPTATQFPSKGSGHYYELPDDAKEPLGKCMNCGEYCYENRNFCSDGCERACLRDYL